ncbi:MAG: hypothetical protein Q7R84_00925 [bacterium]|nr:hypothetical protein [bacterium]
MQATAYFNNLLRRATEAVEKSALEKIRDKSFWDEARGEQKYIGILDIESTINCQGKELEKLGGILKEAGTSYAAWYPPKGSHLYELNFWGHGGKHGLYFLLCLKDGREFLLKLTAKRISLVDHLSPYAYRQLMLEFFYKLYAEEACVAKTIRKLSKTGGYK